MSQRKLLFWKPRPDLRLSADEVARELVWGEEVEGLIDLPIKEVIDRLKQTFPSHHEQPGHLIVNTEAGSFEATWTWQHVQVEPRGLSDDDQRQLSEVLEWFGCVVQELHT